MKKVLDSHSVAHLFAQQSQLEATTPTRNFYFYGKRIYSYGSHFCIAKFADDNTLLFTTRGYSNTTAKHIGITASATRHINRILCPYPDSGHNANFDYWLRDAESIAKYLTTARKPEIYLNRLGVIKSQVQKYASYFKINVPVQLANLLDVANKEQYLQHAEKVAEFKAQEEQKLARKKARIHAQELKEFRDGKVSSIYTRGKYDYIKVTDTDFVTSQRVAIPIGVGLRFYQTIRDAKPGDKLLSYVINEVTPKHIGIGCHKITFEEIDNAVGLTRKLELC